MAFTFPSIPNPRLVVGQDWESMGWLLPRFFLNWAEIHFTPRILADSDVKDCLSFWHSHKVALVRQTAYRGAYLPGTARNWTETVLTAPAHLGPISVLAELQADYFVVRQAAEPETYLWKEKFSGDPDPQIAFRGVVQWQGEQEAMGVLDCEQVRWDDYDLVICLDVPVPARVTSKTRKTIWAYYSVEAGGPLHKRSLAAPIRGYHIYLNHCFRRYRARPGNKSHVLEFPFTFQSSAAWKQLAKGAAAHDLERQGGVVDRASWQSHSGEKPEFMTPLSGNAAGYIRLMSSSQFAIRTDPKTRWGNWALEAVQAGCLFLGRADSLAMPGVLLPDLVVPDLTSSRKTIEALQKDPPRMQALAKTQAALAEHLAFRRPLLELTRLVKKYLAG
jgi:hypothetical protein